MTSLIGSEPCTADELVDAARAQGLNATSRLVRDWTDEGLLCRRQFQKSTRHGSDPGLYLPGQREWFLLLLPVQGKLRQSTRYKRSALLSTTILQWLEEYIPLPLPTQQIPRALRSYTLRADRIPAFKHRQSAKELVENVAHPSAPPVQIRKAVRVIEHASITGKWPRDRIESALTEVCSPWPAPPGQRIERPVNFGHRPLGVSEVLEHLYNEVKVREALRHERVSVTQLDEARRRYRHHYGFPVRKAAFSFTSALSGPAFPIGKVADAGLALGRLRSELATLLEE